MRSLPQKIIHDLCHTLWMRSLPQKIIHDLCHTLWMRSLPQKIIDNLRHTLEWDDYILLITILDHYILVCRNLVSCMYIYIYSSYTTNKITAFHTIWTNLYKLHFEFVRDLFHTLHCEYDLYKLHCLYDMNTCRLRV